MKTRSASNYLESFSFFIKSSLGSGPVIQTKYNSCIAPHKHQYFYVSYEVIKAVIIILWFMKYGRKLL